MEDQQILKFMGGRKFALAIFTLASTAILAWYGKIDAGVYSAVVIANVATFVAGNVYQGKGS